MKMVTVDVALHRRSNADLPVRILTIVSADAGMMEEFRDPDRHTMARILLLTDFSDGSFHAALYAAMLLGVEGNTYRVLHVWSEGSLVGPVMPSYGNLVGIWQEDLDGFVEMFKQRTGIHVEGQELLYGALVPVMDQVVEENTIDLVVVGKYGGGGPVVFGSNAIDVIRSGHASTLVVPFSTPLLPPARIGLADDHHPVPPAELEVLRLIALRNSSRVIILHVQEGSDQPSGPSPDGSYDVGLKGVPHVYQDVPGKDIVESLGLTLGRDSADMLVMVHRHIGPLVRLFDPSITKQMVRHGEIPMLVMHGSA